MGFSRPTLTELIDRVVSDMSSRVLGVDGAVLRRSLLGVIARAEAGAVHLLYGYLDWIAKQAFPDTADTEYLDRWSVVWGVSRKAATFASGNVTFTGTNGASIPAGTILQRQDGQQYATSANATISGGSATVAVDAVLAGLSQNLIAASSVFLVSPISGVQSTVTVAAGGLTNGTDSESDDRLRDRLLRRIQQPPQGGAATDYEQWALEVAGVTRVWVYPNQMGLGTVSVIFVTDDAVGGIIPDSGKILEVEEYIEARRPVTADVYVSAPTPVELDMTINLSPNNSTVRAAVTAELEDMIRRDAEPGGTIMISRLREAVSIATGEADSVIVAPTGNVTHSSGEICVLGEITFGAIV